MSPVHVLELVLMLLAVALALALAARALRIPPAAAYVLGGMALAVTPGAPAVDLDPDLVMALFLPPLLQSSAFFTVWRDFRANLRPILLLAVGCVGFTTLVAGAVLKLLVPALPWAACFAFGAIVSPPDAVSASAVLERLHLPRRLVSVLEGESLVNDASGLVLFRFAVAAVLTGGFNAWEAAGSFAVVGLGGIALGYLFGRAVVWSMPRLGDTRLEIVASFLSAWASYLAAEALGVSGVLATVTCGLLMGWYQHAALSARTRMEAQATWGSVVFVLEALVFILIGLSLRGVLLRVSDHRLLLTWLPLGAVLSVVVMLARMVWVFPATYLPHLLLPGLRAREPIPPVAMLLVVGWSGMRGVVSLAAALALPGSFPGRDLILVLTFCVILATVLVQGTTLGPMVRALGLDAAGGHQRKGPATAPQEAPARAAVDAAMLALIETRATDPLEGAIAQDLLAEYRNRAGWSTRAHRSGGAANAEHMARRVLRLDAIRAGRARLLDLHRDGSIHDEVLMTLERELDLEELRLLDRQR